MLLSKSAGIAGRAPGGSRKSGIVCGYRLADQAVCEFFLSMRVLAESRLAEVEQIKRRFLEGREGMEPVDRDELLKLVREEAVDRPGRSSDRGVQRRPYSRSLIHPP